MKNKLRIGLFLLFICMAFLFLAPSALGSENVIVNVTDGYYAMYCENESFNNDTFFINNKTMLFSNYMNDEWARLNAKMALEKNNVWYNTSFGELDWTAEVLDNNTPKATVKYNSSKQVGPKTAYFEVRYSFNSSDDYLLIKVNVNVTTAIDDSYFRLEIEKIKIDNTTDDDWIAYYNATEDYRMHRLNNSNLDETVNESFINDSYFELVDNDTGKYAWLVFDTNNKTDDKVHVEGGLYPNALVYVRSHGGALNKDQNYALFYAWNDPVKLVYKKLNSTDITRPTDSPGDSDIAKGRFFRIRCMNDYEKVGKLPNTTVYFEYCNSTDCTPNTLIPTDDSGPLKDRSGENPAESTPPSVMHKIIGLEAGDYRVRCSVYDATNDVNKSSEIRNVTVYESTDWTGLGNDLNHSGWSASFAPDYSVYSSSGLTEDINLTLDWEWVYSTPSITSDGIFIQGGEYIYVYDHDGNELWNVSQEGGGNDYSSPTIYNNMLLHIDSYNVYARNMTDGTEIWRFNDTCANTNFNSLDASPMVSNGRVWVPSRAINTYTTACAYTLNLSNGNLINTFQPPDLGTLKVHSLSPATISDGAVYWAVAYGSSDGGRIIAVNESNGTQILWNYTLESLEAPYDSGISIHEDRLFVAIKDKNTSGPSFVLALNKSDGTLLWQYNLTELNQMFARSFPVVYAGKVVVASTKEGWSGPSRVYALNESNGNLLWQYNITDYIWSSPTIADSKVILGTGGSKVYALSTLNGSLIWEYTASDKVESTPSIVDGVIYIGDTNFNGKIHKLKSNTTHSNKSVDLNAGSITSIDARGRADTTLDIMASSTVTGKIHVRKYMDSPGQTKKAFGETALKKYIKVESKDINSNMDWAMVKLYYTDDDITAMGLNESSLKLLHWNGTDWECGQCGVNATENYVWSNATSFSVFGGGGQLYDDWDADWVENKKDNCPTTKNPSQADMDADGVGDACDYNPVDGPSSPGGGPEPEEPAPEETEELSPPEEAPASPAGGGAEGAPEEGGEIEGGGPTGLLALFSSSGAIGAFLGAVIAVVIGGLYVNHLRKKWV